MKTYESMKPSTVFWLGMIPEHWEERFLEQTCHEKCVKNIGNTESNVLSLSYGYIIKKKNVYSGLVAKDFSTYQIVQNGDIILRFTDLQNDHKSLRTGLVTQTGIITSAYTCIVPTINSAYLHYLLHAYDLRKVFYGMGGGVRQSIGYKDVRHMTVLVPPREEQDQIVRFLDWKVSEINRLINIKRKEIERLEELKRSEIGHVIMGGLINSSHKETAVSWVKSIPKHWEEKSVIQVAEEQQVKNAGMIEDNLLSLSYGKIINKDINTTDGLLPASFEGYQIVYAGNIILRLTDLQNDHKSLRTGLATQKGIITSAYTCLKVRHGMNPEYLQLQLHVADLCKVFYGMGGGVRQSIGFKEIRKLLIAVPPIEEQEQILEIVHQIEEPINNTIQKYNEIIVALQDLKNRLISDVVTGKIDVRGIEIPEYEYVDEVAGSDTEDADSEEAIEAQEE